LLAALSEWAIDPVPDNFPRPGPLQRSRQAIIFRLAALFFILSAMRQNWMKANYFVAIVVAMIGWLWLIVWIARQLI
jgi:hypothetical protein